MSSPFVAQLRSRPVAIRLGRDGQRLITVRVQMAEIWDTVRIETPAEEPVQSVKIRALQELLPDADRPEDFVLKLNGFEVLDEHAALSVAGAVDGSIFLLTYRRRRPVR